MYWIFRKLWPLLFVLSCKTNKSASNSSGQVSSKEQNLTVTESMLTIENYGVDGNANFNLAQDAVTVPVGRVSADVPDSLSFQKLDLSIARLIQVDIAKGVFVELGSAKAIPAACYSFALDLEKPSLLLSDYSFIEDAIDQSSIQFYLAAAGHLCIGDNQRIQSIDNKSLYGVNIESNQNFLKFLNDNQVLNIDNPDGGLHVTGSGAEGLAKTLSRLGDSADFPPNIAIPAKVERPVSFHVRKVRRGSVYVGKSSPKPKVISPATSPVDQPPVKIHAAGSQPNSVVLPKGLTRAEEDALSSVRRKTATKAILIPEGAVDKVQSQIRGGQFELKLGRTPDGTMEFSDLGAGGQGSVYRLKIFATKDTAEFTMAVKVFKKSGASKSGSADGSYSGSSSEESMGRSLNIDKDSFDMMNVNAGKSNSFSKGSDRMGESLSADASFSSQGSNASSKSGWSVSQAGAETTVLDEIANYEALKASGVSGVAKYYGKLDFEGGQLLCIEDLAVSLDKKATFDVKDFAKTAHALNEIHAKNYIHGDVKLGNIGLDAAGDIRLLDLGFSAKLVKGQRHTSGSPGYLAPENASSEFLSVGKDGLYYYKGTEEPYNPAQSDVYSLAMSIFRKKNWPNHKEPPAGQEFGQKFGALSASQDLLDKLLVKALEKDPSKRINMQTFEIELNKIAYPPK